MPKKFAEYNPSFSRRQFIHMLSLAAAGTTLGLNRPAHLRAEQQKQIAVLTNIYRYRGHGLHFTDRFLRGYYLNGKYHLPKHKLVSIYEDQKIEFDVSEERSQKYGVRISPSIDDALTHGTKNLIVDGTAIVSEGGNYDKNDQDKWLWPRHEMFRQAVLVYKRTGKTAPIFNDKHFSYDWNQAKWMYDIARDMGFGLMGGSSIPLTWRLPPLEFPIGVPIKEALVIGYSVIDRYDYHALEGLQCMVERRQGGETGIKAIQCLEGEAVWRAFKQGRWDRELFQTALARCNTWKSGRTNYTYTEPDDESWMKHVKNPVAYCIEYRDGLKGTMLLLNGLVEEFSFAARVQGNPEVQSTLFLLKQRPQINHFSMFTRYVEEFFDTGQSPWKTERSLLTTGMTIFGVESRFQNHRRLETPELAIRYQPTDRSFFNKGWE